MSSKVQSLAMSMFFPFVYDGICVCCDMEMESGTSFFCTDCIGAGCELDDTVMKSDVFDPDIFDLSEACL